MMFDLEDIAMSILSTECMQKNKTNYKKRLLDTNFVEVKN